MKMLSKSITVLLALLLTASIVLAQQAFPPRTATLEEAQSTGNGTEVSVTGYSVITLEIVGSEAGTDRVVTFEGYQDATASFAAIQCVNQSTRVVGTTLTTSGVTAFHVQCDIAGFNRFRAPLSAGATGNVTVTATAISNSSAGITAAVTTPASGAVGDVNVEQWNNQTVTGGACSVAAGTPRMTLASDDPAVASLSVLDDWDETNRAAVNLIAGQVAVAGGTGVDAANVPRVSLATNIGLPTGTNSIGQVTANAGTNLNTSALLTTTAHDAALGVAGTADAQVRSVQGIAGMTAVVVDGSAVTQPVSGTVTANAGTNLNTSALLTTAAHDAALGVAGTADAQVRSVQGIAGGTALPVSGTLTCDAGTNLNTSALLTTAAHDAALGTAGAADAQVRTVQGVASMTPLQVEGTAADNAPATGNPNPVGGIYRTADAPGTALDRLEFVTDSRGRQVVAIGVFDGSAGAAATVDIPSNPGDARTLGRTM